MVRVLLLALLAVLGVGVAMPPSPTRPKYIDCVTSNECGPWECCVLGTGRFSLPKCSPMGDVGDSCSPTRAERGGVTLNVTVSYPDGQRVHLPAVYARTCPCLSDLRCDQEGAVCSASLDVGMDNTDNTL